jgi:hypothetical protein
MNQANNPNQGGQQKPGQPNQQPDQGCQQQGGGEHKPQGASGVSKECIAAPLVQTDMGF